MTTPHKVLMSGFTTQANVEFFKGLTPPDFELVRVENPKDLATVATVLKDVEFCYGSLLVHPPSLGHSWEQADARATTRLVSTATPHTKGCRCLFQ